MKRKIQPSPLLFTMFEVFRKSGKQLSAKEIVDKIVTSGNLIPSQCETIVSDALDNNILVITSRKEGNMFKLSAAALNALTRDFLSEMLRASEKFTDVLRLKKLYIGK
jgi:hypothetical protein